MIPKAHHLRSLAYQTRLWASGLAVRAGLRSSIDRMLRPRIVGDVPRATAQDVLRFIQGTGGQVDAYRLPDSNLVTPHGWFATWGTPELARALVAAHLPLNVSHFIHAGASTRVHRMPAIDEPLRFAATVETVVRTGKRVRIEQNLVTTSVRGELVAEQTVSVVLPAGRRPWSNPSRRQEPVPESARHLATHDLAASQGWQFAILSGDFNPVHWVPAWAKLSGLDGPVAHGFDLFARLGHVAVTELADRHPERVRAIEARFRQPVCLPARIALLAGQPTPVGSGCHRYPLWIAAAPGGTANVVAFVEVAS